MKTQEKKDRESAIYKKGRVDGYKSAQEDFTYHIKEKVKAKVVDLVKLELDKLLEDVTAC